MDLVNAIIIAIVEGLTEYLPVSSTAHMIFTSSFLGIEKEGFVKMFQVSIQFGAILAVIFLYWKKFFNFKDIQFYIKLAVGVLPALLLGYFFDDYIEKVLEKPVPIAVVLIIGGIILLFIDKVFTKQVIQSEKEITYKNALAIGFWQCLAMMPGTSRSAASIIGGMQQKLSRETAAEFSFFLAVPTMMAVTLYSVFLKKWDIIGGSGEHLKIKGYQMLTEGNNLMYFLLGNTIAFIVAVLAIKFFIGVIKKFGFKPWGWYRILAGHLLLFYFYK